MIVMEGRNVISGPFTRDFVTTEMADVPYSNIQFTIWSMQMTPYILQASTAPQLQSFLDSMLSNI